MKRNKENSFSRFSITSLRTSVGTQPQKNQLKLSYLRLSKKTRSLIAIGIIAIILVSVFVLLPKTGNSKDPYLPQSSDSPTASPSRSSTPQHVSKSPSPSPWNPLPIGSTPTYVKPPGIIETANPINNATWVAIAKQAWSFFTPKIGVNEETGLPYAGGTGFESFTDWDLGVYIQSTINTQKIGLIETDGDLGSYARMDKVLTFLETRELNATTHYPFWFYSATDGKSDRSMSDKTSGLDVMDTGRLFVALNNLRTYNSNWTQRINNIVYNQVVNQVGNRTNYAAFVPYVNSEGLGSNSMYSYYMTSGFASFWPQQLGTVPSVILNNLANSPRIVNCSGILLPQTSISCEPLLCSIFEVSNDSELTTFAKQVYLAHEGYFNNTGDYAAFSEGGGTTQDYLYESVVTPYGSTWKVQTASQVGTNSYTNINPVIYTKVAFSFLALYGTPYSKNMVVYLEDTLPYPTGGYNDGADNVGKIATEIGSNTNGLILDAALYYIQNHPN